MKSITDYLCESAEWKWRNYALSSKETENYMNNIRKWVKETYGNTHGDSMLQAYKDTYKDYLIASFKESGNIDETKIEKRYKEQIEYATRIVTKMSWSQFEAFCLEQGWVDYVNWKINNE